MSMAETANLIVNLGLKDNLTPGLEKASKSVGGFSKTASALGTALKSLGGAAIGAAFGAALAGANELDAATRRLQADTGLVGQEAKDAQGALASMYRGNLQGFSEIGAAMAAVHNDLGLTGDAANKATNAFLKFATATGQDAAAGIMVFNDILDAWNLNADSSLEIMDRLIASHQEFGGVIAVSQSALVAMAPAMQAANMTIDDGIALLNLFNQSGVDASSAAQMLTQAVARLKPGQSLGDLIDQISSIEDPAARAAAAVAVFGARGLKMSQVLRPGIDLIKDFGVTAEEAAGKMVKAADAIEGGFGNRLQAMLKQVSGYLAEFGMQLGDLVIVGALLGPKFATMIGAAFGAVIPLIAGKIVAAIAAATIPASVASNVLGVAAGTLFGTGFSLAATAALIAAPVAVILVAQGLIADFLGLSGKQTGPAGTWSPQLGGWFKIPEPVIPVTIEPDEAASGQAFRDYLAEMKRMGKEGLDYGEWLKLSAADRAAASAAGASLGAAVTAGIAQSRPKNDLWSQLNVPAVPNPLRNLRDLGVSTAYDAKRLPAELVLANSEMAAADKAFKSGRTADGKKFTREQKAEAEIRVYNAHQAVSELNRKNADLTADYGKTGIALGEALMIPLYNVVGDYTARINALLGGIGEAPGGGWAKRPTKVVKSLPGKSNTEPLAAGGPVHPGGSYLVGEQGPELFTPGQSGTIIPNGGGRSMTFSPNIYITSKPTFTVRDLVKQTRVKARYTTVTA